MEHPRRPRGVCWINMMLRATLIGNTTIKTIVDALIIPNTMRWIYCKIVYKNIKLPWHWRYFFRLSKPIYPGAPMIRTRKNICTSLLSCFGCPRPRRMGSIKAHKMHTGTRRAHSNTMHLWRWMDRSVGWLPPVNDCDPRVSRAVDPPSATHHPVVYNRMWDHRSVN